MTGSALGRKAREFALSDPPGEQPRPLRWTPLTRRIFRFSFCYYAVWITLNGNATVWEAIPVFGRRLEGWLWLPLGRTAQWLGRTLLHLHGPTAHWISSGVSDSALTVILTCCYIGCALVGATVWTLLDRGRGDYQTLLAWMRFALRLTVGIGLISYGIAKLIPAGQPPLDQAALNAQLGSLPPAMALWTVSRVSRGLVITEGVLEVLVGAMLLFRRSALFGALMIFFGIGAVLIVEIYFHMPVRIFTGHLMLADGSIILPDLASVLAFFWSHREAAPRGIWIDPSRRRTFRAATLLTEAILVGLILTQVVVSGGHRFFEEHVARRNPQPLLGAWQVASTGAPAPLTAKDGLAVISVWFNRQMGRGSFAITLETSNSQLWSGSARLDPDAGTLSLRGRYTVPRLYALHWEGAGKLDLTAHPAPGRPPYADEILTRIPLPSQYRLLQKHSAMVDKDGYSR